MDLRQLRGKASEALTKGRFGKAAELYAEYCEQDPRDIQARLRMGDAWARAGERQKAIAAYKAAAEAFAKEGFLPRAIAASKLILELDPSHSGVQQMLAGLYARKTSGAGRSSTRSEVPGATVATASLRARHAPIDLPEEEPPAPPPGNDAPVEWAGEEPSGTPAGTLELPPELQIFSPVAEPEVESAGAKPLQASPEAVDGPSAPPGLRRRTIAIEVSAAALRQASVAPHTPSPHPSETAGSSAIAAAVSESKARLAVPRAVRSAEPVAAPTAASTQGPSEAVTRATAVGPPPGAEAPWRSEAVTPKAASMPFARPANSDLQRAFSRFDELSLEDAPVTPIGPSTSATEGAVPVSATAPEAKLPSFTELELDGDSLLHAVEVAALAGRTQRGEAPAEEEEEVFSTTAENSADARNTEELPKIPLFSDLPPEMRSSSCSSAARCGDTAWANGSSRRTASETRSTWSVKARSAWSAQTALPRASWPLSPRAPSSARWRCSRARRAPHPSRARRRTRSCWRSPRRCSRSCRCGTRRWPARSRSSAVSACSPT